MKLNSGALMKLIKCFHMFTMSYSIVKGVNKTVFTYVIFAFLGRGVFTHKAVEPSAFVVEYRGNIFPHEDARPKQKHGDTLNNYLFEFSWEGEHWW